MSAAVPRRRHPVPAATRAALLRALATGMSPLKAVPPQRFADWAREHFMLSADSSHRKGQWSAWPFQVGWMDAFSNDDIEQVDVQKAKRTGYTKTLTAYVGYCVAHRNRKIAVWQPTDDDRDSFVKSEIDPMIDEVPAVRAARRSTKVADQSIKYKLFRTTVAHFLGGKAARAYRRITLDAAVLDELDGFDQQIEKSSDPVTLARGRLEGAPFPKFICGSTPRIKGLSHIERQVEAADARLRFRIACPHCGAEHPLAWGDKKTRHGFKWERGDDGAPVNVRHVCPHCHGAIGQADYLRVWASGAWVCDRTGLRYGADRTWRNDRGDAVKPPRHVAFTEAWTAYSPQRAWHDIVREFLEAHRALKAGDSGPMQGFHNETLARTWEEQYERTEGEALQRRARAEGLPLAIVPAEASVVTMFIDVQGDRWELVTYAHGRGAEKWALEYRVIYGNPADYTEWMAKIAPLVNTTYPHARGGRLGLSALGVDSGFLAHMAYTFARDYKDHHVYATKGDSQPGKPIKGKRSLQDINVRGRVIRRGVGLWHVGTDTAKDLLHGRLQLEGRGPGRVHFAAELSDAFFAQLTAEQRVPVRSVRGLEYRWECPAGKRNEVLDCTVGNMFLAEVLDLPRWTDRQWLRAENALAPDLFDLPPAPPEPPAPAGQAQIMVEPAAPPARTRRALPRPAPTVATSDEWSSRL